VESTASVYLDNVSHMLGRCEERRLPCLVFVQPAQVVTRRHQGGAKRGAGELLTAGAYDEILRRLRAPPADPRIRDLTAVFSGPEASAWFADGVHFTDPGHRALAEAMLPGALEALRARLPTEAPVAAGRR
jgi:hypothetical protein